MNVIVGPEKKKVIQNVIAGPVKLIVYNTGKFKKKNMYKTVKENVIVHPAIVYTTGKYKTN
jgi:hypothetical protein